MKRILGSLLVVLALGAALFLFSRREKGPVGPSEVLDQAFDVGGHGALPAEVPGAGETIAAPQSQEARAQVAIRDALGSRLRGPDGAPVVGARVTWTPLRPEFFGPWVGWATQRWGEIEAASLEAVTDADGAFAFGLPPAGSEVHPGALWITHAGHAPELVLLGQASADLTFPASIELRPAAPIHVRVVDGQGAAVEGAEVWQTSPIPQSSLADTWAPQARRVLARKAVTGDGGVVQVAAWDGALLLTAALGERASEVWIGAPRAHVELTLQPTFEVLGRVDYSGGEGLEGAQRIVCSALFGSQSQPLAVAPVEQGSFGPLRLPLVAADRFRFRLEGWNAEIRAQTIAPPAAGASVRVDFEARAGLDIWTLVVNGADEPLMDAETTLVWEQGGARVELLGYPREDGFILNRGVPAGIITVHARARGHASATLGPLSVPSEPPATYDVMLEPGRLLEGRVVRGGQPVEDFEITSWPNEPACAETLAFREREGGHFSLVIDADESVRLVATAAGCGPSEVVLVPPTQTEPVTLTLNAAVRGIGVVVDGASGAPLAEARLQTFLTSGLRAIEPWGLELDVGPDGRFDHTAFAVGRARTRISAPGYSNHWTETHGQPGQVLDFGSLALGRRQDLTLRLGSDGELDGGEYVVFGTGAEPIPRTTFGPDGRLVIEDLSAGVYYTILEGPNSYRLRHTLVLKPGEDWIVDLPVGGSRLLRVQVEFGARQPAELIVQAHLPAGQDQPLQVYGNIGPDGFTEFRGVRPGDYQVYLLTLDGVIVGSTNGRILEQDSVIAARLEPFSSTHQVLVVDRQGLPVADADLGVWDPRTLAGNAGVTGADGLCTLTGLEPGTYMARVVHPTRGSHFNLPITIQGGEQQAFELVFAPDSALELELRDGTEPLAGVACWPWEEHRLYGLPAATTDSAGRVRWGPLGAGRFEVELRHPDLWPTEAQVEARPPGEATEVQARRLGNVELELRDALGAALGGRALELTSLEFGTPVSTWLAAGRATSSGGGLRTAGDGTLTLTGLPRGRYEWSLAAAGGTFEVLPGATERVRLVVP